METEENAETLDFDLTLTVLIAPEDFGTLSKLFSRCSKLNNKKLNRSSSV
jgi:hypothetical protein